MQKCFFNSCILYLKGFNNILLNLKYQFIILFQKLFYIKHHIFYFFIKILISNTFLYKYIINKYIKQKSEKGLNNIIKLYAKMIIN